MKKNILSIMFIGFSIIISGCSSAEPGADQQDSQQLPVAEEKESNPNQTTSVSISVFDPDAKEEINNDEDEAPLYEDYSVEKHESLKGNSAFTLFFFSEECKNCKKYDSQLATKITGLIPNTVILKVDSDTNTELVKEYDIQKNVATFIIFDSFGEQIYKGIDPYFSEVLAAIERAMMN